MSTRANIVITDERGNKLFFYRHSDGYPEGAMPTLEKFMSWVKEGKIRNNVGQASGWLIMLGNLEYEQKNEPTNDGYSGWKVGAYEPTPYIHGDIEYLYHLDLEKQTITTHTSNFDSWEKKNK